MASLEPAENAARDAARAELESDMQQALEALSPAASAVAIVDDLANRGFALSGLSFSNEVTYRMQTLTVEETAEVFAALRAVYARRAAPLEAAVADLRAKILAI